MNADIPKIDCWVRPEFLYGEGTDNPPEQGIAFAVCGLYGQALTFHVMLRSGAIRGRVPIHALMQTRDTVTDLTLPDLELWDCMSYNPCVIEYAYLSQMRVKTVLRNGLWYGGEYLFTVDWHGSQEAESAGENGWKCHHIIALDCGMFAAQPNNRTLWFDPAFTDTKDPPRYRTAERTYKCESTGKWRTVGEGVMFYGVETTDEGTH
jgi:hypothetical protein